MNWLDILGPATRHRDRKSPVYGRLTKAIKEAIQSGRLNPNERLPADRELAKILGLDRSTIARAYDQLEAEGLVHSQVGRGTFVSAVAPQAVRGNKEFATPLGSLLWSDKFSRASQTTVSIMGRQAFANASSEGVISLAGGTPTQEFLPQDEFRDIVETLVRSRDALDMFGYSEPEGNPKLRQEVRTHLRRQGIEASNDELLILSGSQQGIDLVARTLVDPGDLVVLEDPSYFWAICNFESTGARTVGVPVDKDGLRLDLLDAVLSRQRAKLLYVMPSFQNPTGATLSLEKRKQLLELANYHQVAVLEDNFVGDLSYETDSPPPLKALDKFGAVIYQGTFSKALCPGLRLGWIVAPAEVLSRLNVAKRTCDLSTNSMAQVIVAEYLQRGLYEKHLQVVRSAYRARREVFCAALQKHAEAIQWDKPDGGMFVWAKLPPGYSARDLLQFAEREGVTFSPGDMFFLANGRHEFLRMSFIQHDEETLVRAAERLGRALKAYSASLAKGASKRQRYTESTFV